MDGVLEIEMGGHRGQVVGIVIHVVTVAGLRGASVPAPVMGDDAVAMAAGRTGIWVSQSVRPKSGQPWLKTIGWARAPVLVEDLPCHRSS